MKRSHHLPTIAAVLLSTAWAAQAQSTPRYAMTVLAIPAGATHSSAFALDAAGNAMGSVNTEFTTTRTCGGDFGNPSVDWLFVRKCPVLNTSAQEATWPAGSGATQSPTLGVSNFITVGVSSNGTQLGVRGTTMNSELEGLDLVYTNSSPSYDSALGPWRLARVANSSGDIGTKYKSLVLKTGATITNVPFAPSTGLRFPSLFGRVWETQARGITSTGKLLVNAIGETSTSVPYLFSDGKYTKLNDSLAPGKLLGTAINNAGLVVGSRLTTLQDSDVARPVLPVRWQNGAAADLGGSELRGYVPEAVNASGQVLLQREITRSNDQPVFEAAVWSNGALTRLTLPPDDGTQLSKYARQPWGVIPTAMNARGDVAGCGSLTFVWRDGVMHDLNKLLAASGFKTPNGRPLSCVSAMNDQGVILANYLVSAPGKFPLNYGWVRLTPVP